MINRARQLVGREWGLEVNDIVQNDEHIGCGGNASKEEYIAVLKANYVPPRLVDSIRARIIYDGNNTLINDYMQHHLPANIDIATLFESNGTTINCRGVAWLLQSHGFLN